MMRANRRQDACARFCSPLTAAVSFLLLHLSAQAVAAVPIASVAAAAALAAAASAAAGLLAVSAELAASAELAVAFELAEGAPAAVVAPRDALVRDSVALEPAVATVPPFVVVPVADTAVVCFPSAVPVLALAEFDFAVAAPPAVVVVKLSSVGAWLLSALAAVDEA